MLSRVISVPDAPQKRTANDTCVYVCKAGDRTKKMVVVRPGETWQGFLDNVGHRLNVIAKRVFNTHDEIREVADIVQGDILFVKPYSQLDSPNASPKSPHGRGDGNMPHNIMLRWNRVVRLVNLQCVKGYLITEVIKSERYTETFRAKRVKDDMQVVIKRIGETPTVKLSTLKSYVLEISSIRHPNYAHNLDMLISDDRRRPLGGSKARKKVRAGGRHECICLIMERYHGNLESLMDERIKLQKQLTSDEIIRYVTQVLQLLHHLHADVKVVHRNLKLTNLLVDSKGDLYVHDVAVPGADPSSEAYDMRHMSRIPLSSRGRLSPYCSPEAHQTGIISEKDDIWALGCIITELVTNTLVIDRMVDDKSFGNSLGAVAQAVAEVAIKDSSMGGLCRLLLEADKQKRPSAMEALWKHLRVQHDPSPAHALPLLSAHERANVGSLSKSTDIPTLISAILKDGTYQAMEAAIARLNEILYQEPAKRGSMREVYATPSGRQSGIAAICLCLNRGTPLAQQSAAAALRTAMLDDGNDQSVSQADVEVMVAAVLMGTGPTQLHGAAAIANICCRNHANRDKVHRAGGIGALAALLSNCGMQAHAIHTAILEAASAVRNACIGHAGNREALCRARAVPSLVRVLLEESSVPMSLRERQTAIHEHVAGALRNACNKHNGNSMLFAEADGVSLAMRLLTSSSLTVQEQVVGLLRNACIGYYGNKDQLTKCGGYWNLVQMLKQPVRTDALQEEIVSAVRYSTVGHELNKVAAGEAGLIRALVHVISPGPQEGTGRAKEEVAASLRIVCDGSEQNSAEMLKCGGVPALLELVASGSPSCREEAVAALANCCCCWPPNLDFISAKGRGHVRAMLGAAETQEEGRLYAKCVLMLLDQRRLKLSGGPRAVSLAARPSQLAHVARDLTWSIGAPSWCPPPPAARSPDPRTSLDADGEATGAAHDGAGESLPALGPGLGRKREQRKSKRLEQRWDGRWPEFTKAELRASTGGIRDRLSPPLRGPQLLVLEPSQRSPQAAKAVVSEQESGGESTAKPEQEREKEAARAVQVEKHAGRLQTRVSAEWGAETPLRRWESEYDGATSISPLKAAAADGRVLGRSIPPLAE